MPTPTTIATLPDGREVREITLSRNGAQLRVLDLGATVTSYRSDAGDPASEMIIGFDDFEQQQLASKAYFGAALGRYPNRIANGRFTLDGREVQLSTNEGSTHLHGGVDGFAHRTWQVDQLSDEQVIFALTSPDGDQGFPGQVQASVTYTMLEDGFSIDFDAVSDTTTVLGMTTHIYVNLNPGASGSIDDHELQVFGDTYCPVDELSIPVGVMAPVEGTPFDFRTPARLGDRVRVDDEQIGLAGGIDHAFGVSGEGLRPQVVVRDPRSGRRLEMVSNQPAIQVYTGNKLDGTWVSRGGRLRQGDGLALEPGLVPDAPNQSWAPTAIVQAGEHFTNRIEYHLS